MSMNQLLLTIKRPFVRLSRFRHRQGYGVHSPFAFNFITQVIYQRTPYYKYSDLLKAEKEWIRTAPPCPWNESLPMKRLLFRLVNHARPANIVDAGTPTPASLYLQAGRTGAEYVNAQGVEELSQKVKETVDFLYLHDWNHPEFVEEAFRICVNRTTPQSMFVINGIGYTPHMRALWKKLRQEEAAGITFDLYDAGILFFDKTMNKQDYIVCF